MKKTTMMFTGANAHRWKSGGSVVNVTQKLLRFGAFELNVDTEELFKSGIPVKLPPQPVKLLGLLASHAGQVVTRDDIQRKLWVGETFVDFEHGVNKCINQIRTVLGDNADHPIYIQTLPRRGYRFVAPVASKTIPAPQPKVIESDFGERRFPVLIGSRMGAATAEAAVASYPEVMPDARTAAEPVGEIAPAQKARYRLSRASLAGSERRSCWFYRPAAGFTGALEVFREGEKDYFLKAARRSWSCTRAGWTSRLSV